jgi:hypothetical protein
MNGKPPIPDASAPRRKHIAATKLEIEAIEPSGGGRKEGEDGEDGEDGEEDGVG